MARPSSVYTPARVGQDARGMRGILSRGHARYGPSNSPKPGNINNVQRAAKQRLKKFQGINDGRKTR